MCYKPPTAAISVTVLQLLLFVAFSSLVQNGSPSTHQLLCYVPIGLYAASTIAQVVSFTISYVRDTRNSKYADKNFAGTATYCGILLYRAAVIYTVVGAITVQLTDIKPLFQSIITAGISTLVVLASIKILPQIDQLEEVACSNQIKAYVHRLVLIEIFAFGIHRWLVNTRVLHGDQISFLLVALSVVLAAVLCYTTHDYKNSTCQQTTGEPQHTSHETDTRKPCLDSHRCGDGDSLLQKNTATCILLAKDRHGEQRACDKNKQSIGILVTIYFFVTIIVTNGLVLLFPMMLNSHILQKQDTDVLTLLDDLPRTLLSNLPLIVAVASVLIYQLLYSMFGHKKLTHLKNIGVGITLLSIGTIFKLLTASRFQIKPTITFTIKGTSDPQQNVLIQLSLANFILIVANLLVQIGGLEYICNDSPKGMKLPLFATFWSTRSLFWYVVFIALFRNGTPHIPAMATFETEYSLVGLATILFLLCFTAYLYMCSKVRKKAADLELESVLESSNTNW